MSATPLCSRLPVFEYDPHENAVENALDRIPLQRCVCFQRRPQRLREGPQGRQDPERVTCHRSGREVLKRQHFAGLCLLKTLLGVHAQV